MDQEIDITNEVLSFIQYDRIKNNISDNFILDGIMPENIDYPARKRLNYRVNLDEEIDVSIKEIVNDMRKLFYHKILKYNILEVKLSELILNEDNNKLERFVLVKFFITKYSL